MEVLTNNNIKDAVNLWCDYEDQANDFFGHISEWDVSRVTDMSNLFEDKIDFNEDISKWDVSNVTNMCNMFSSAESFDQSLCCWDVSNVTNMNYMFNWAKSFNQPLNNWDVSNVTNMNGMFAVAKSFNQPLNDWDVSNVLNMYRMFDNAIEFNQPLNNWDVSNVTNMSGMFESAESFNDNEISSWIINDNCIISDMFKNSSIKREDIENKNYGNKIASYFKLPLPNPKTNDELEKIKIERIKSNIRILEENKNLPILCDDVEIIIKDFLIKTKY